MRLCAGYSAQPSTFRMSRDGPDHSANIESKVEVDRTMAGGSMKRQKTGGRKLGVKNKPTLARERAAAEKIRDVTGPALFEGDAHAFLMVTYKDPTQPMELRLDAATAAIGYEKPQTPSRSKARFAGWNLDLASRELLSPSGEKVRLTTGAFDLLAAFVNNANQVLTRDRLLADARKRAAGPNDRTIDIQIGRLRSKLEDDRGRGKTHLQRTTGRPPQSDCGRSAS
jgi:Transcriptional regulatory protein, C terminal